MLQVSATESKSNSKSVIVRKKMTLIALCNQGVHSKDVNGKFGIQILTGTLREKIL